MLLLDQILQFYSTVISWTNVLVHFILSTEFVFLVGAS